METVISEKRTRGSGLVSFVLGIIAAFVLAWSLGADAHPQSGPVPVEAGPRIVAQARPPASASPEPTVAIGDPSDGPRMGPDQPEPTPAPSPVLPTGDVVAAGLPSAGVRPIAGGTGAPRSSGGDGVEQWRGIIASYFDAANVDAALRVVNCESRGRPDAQSGDGAEGLFQVMPHWHQAKADVLFGPGASLYDPVVNVAVAAVISNRGNNWNAWTCQP